MIMNLIHRPLLVVNTIIKKYKRDKNKDRV